ncbi:L-pipecolate oxidase [Tolypocladium ophioglossoides CBS 100239]|uniref:L-pipecolate oxidase n=1 Tax=Tolypocladium ophioglossoides (strain CBS 100239) TaxID=1163406 RepID=A0A0L0ND32_TOLOC|nr:L-pipecolate oxidase [Tolypocladium ophioglossoides CBS 100239]
MVSSESKIIIVGAGVFGLSTAFWLAREGYKNITVFDRCAFDKNYYNPSNGCDGASADINKVFRMAYWGKLEYQALAIEARDVWLSWNKRIAESGPSDLPAGLTPEDKLLDMCGCYFLAAGPTLRGSYAESLDTMERTAPEFRKMQFVKGNAEDEERLGIIGAKWAGKHRMVQKFNRGNTNGFVDVNAGFTIADKACVYARFLCEQDGVKFVLGDSQGKIETMVVEQRGQQKKVTGIQTCDGRSHFGDLVIVAAGSWTPSIIPEAHRAIEATAGTVMFIDIPRHRQDLWEPFHPDNFPVWFYQKGDGDDYFEGVGFPITKEGRLKFGFRGRKVSEAQCSCYRLMIQMFGCRAVHQFPRPSHRTQSVCSKGLPMFAMHAHKRSRISTPRTKYSNNPIGTVPLHGLSLMKEVVAEAFPELADFGFTDSKLCWYTDSIDNDYVIDFVPGYSDSLFICTGGSGHAFKFLPILGRHVKNRLGGVSDQFTSLWKWRVAEGGKENNGLSEGETGPREMSNLQMADPRDFKFENAGVVSKL